MFGMTLGMLVESSVAVLLAVTIGYCALLNARLKRLHADRGTMTKMVSDLMQATTLANAADKELKTAALEAETSLNERLEEAQELEAKLASQVSNGSQLVEKIGRITAAARTQPMVESKPEPKAPSQPVEPQSRLHSALQQLAMRPGIGGRAA